jgi:hypothetical protein
MDLHRCPDLTASQDELESSAREAVRELRRLSSIAPNALAAAGRARVARVPLDGVQAQVTRRHAAAEALSLSYAVDVAFSQRLLTVLRARKQVVDFFGRFRRKR